MSSTSSFEPSDSDERLNAIISNYEPITIHFNDKLTFEKSLKKFRECAENLEWKEDDISYVEEHLKGGYSTDVMGDLIIFYLWYK